MHERRKHDEAKYFYDRMVGELGCPLHFEYNLSAFLNASRSVLQYAQKEATTRPNGQQWYDNEMGARSTLRFFRDCRDTNIHAAPIQPSTGVTVNAPVIALRLKPPSHLTASEIAAFSQSIVEILVSGRTATKDELELVAQSTVMQDAQEPGSVTYTFHFRDWTGNEDCLQLCNKHLNELDGLIREGIQKGFIAG